MNKVYVVTSGVYSDYGIDCVFDNLEDAERYIFMCKKDDEYYSGNIETYELKTCTFHDNEKMYKGIDFIYYTISDSLNTAVFFSENPIKLKITQSNNGSIYGYIPISKRIKMEDKDVIEKIVYDTVAKFKAEEAGIC